MAKQVSLQQCCTSVGADAALEAQKEDPHFEASQGDSETMAQNKSANPKGWDAVQ